MLPLICAWLYSTVFQHRLLHVLLSVWGGKEFSGRWRVVERCAGEHIFVNGIKKARAGQGLVRLQSSIPGRAILIGGVNVH